MPSASEVIHAYFLKLEGLIDKFDFTRQGHGESLGKEAAAHVADGIRDRSVKEQGGPDGAWPANEPKYTARKNQLYNTTLIGFRTGQMLSQPSLLGRVDVTPHLVEIHYGTGKAPSDSMHGYISDQDKLVTDTEKAGYFTDLKGAFFVLDTTIADKIRGYFADELDKFIRELNAR